MEHKQLSIFALPIVTFKFTDHVQRQSHAAGERERDGGWEERAVTPDMTAVTRSVSREVRGPAIAQTPDTGSRQQKAAGDLPDAERAQSQAQIELHQSKECCD